MEQINMDCGLAFKDGYKAHGCLGVMTDGVVEDSTISQLSIYMFILDDHVVHNDRWTCDHIEDLV